MNVPNGEAAKFLNVALSLLPLHAEEGRKRDVLLESELVSILINQSGANPDTALSLVYALRRHFEALSLLDQIELRSGRWAFVSFPASLLGRSWLTTLATPGQVLLPANYWEQGDAETNEKKEEQRSLLHLVELGRLRFNPQATTIRTVHVSWAFIRLGNNFLMHHREDKKRLGEKSYVFPGGRFRLSDLPIDLQERQDILKEIFDPESEIVKQHIVRTLEREIEEETGLLQGFHYNHRQLRDHLQIYREVNGAGNRHAYTSYKFYLFYTTLTQAGETLLIKNVSDSAGKLTWFSVADIIANHRADGASAYVDALRQAWGLEMEQRLFDIPDSSTTQISYISESCMLDLPYHIDGKFYFGKPGKEKPLMPLSPLDNKEWQLLMLMGWHTRGFPIQESDEIRLLENGWIDAFMAIDVIKSLQQKLHGILPGFIEIREDRYVSLGITPAIVFFPVSLFRYKIAGSNTKGGTFRLEREELQTPWGLLQGGIYEKDITGRTTTTLRELEKGDEPNGDWERNLREQFGEGVRGIGLRRLWSNKGNSSCLIAGLRRISDP